MPGRRAVKFCLGQPTVYGPALAFANMFYRSSVKFALVLSPPHGFLSPER
jgi:hypothetical protein